MRTVIPVVIVKSMKCVAAMSARDDGMARYR
jgi:hypothetical protein